MADLIKKIKIKKQDGTFTDYIPIGAEAQNISTSDGDSVQLKLNRKPYYYNTVADMKADTKLKVGDMAITLGYYAPNDGGRAEYKIVNGNYTDNGGSHHELDNNLWAELIIFDEINLNSWGLSTSLNDNSSIFNTAITYAADNNIPVLKIHKKGVYKINNPIVVYNNITLDGNQASIKKMDNSTYNDINAILYFKTYNSRFDYCEDINIYNCNLQGNSIADYGIYYEVGGTRTVIEDVNINNCKYGVKTNDIWVCTFSKMAIGSCTEVGLNCGDKGTTLNVNEIYCMSCKVGYLFQGISYSNIHNLACDWATETAYEFSFCTLTVSSLGCESTNVKNVIKAHNSFINFNGGVLYANTSNSDANMISLGGSKLVFTSVAFGQKHVGLISVPGRFVNAGSNSYITFNSCRPPSFKFLTTNRGTSEAVLSFTGDRKGGTYTQGRYSVMNKNDTSYFDAFPIYAPTDDGTEIKDGNIYFNVYNSPMVGVKNRDNAWSRRAYAGDLFVNQGNNKTGIALYQQTSLESKIDIINPIISIENNTLTFDSIVYGDEVIQCGFSLKNGDEITNGNGATGTISAITSTTITLTNVTGTFNVGDYVYKKAPTYMRDVNYKAIQQVLYGTSGNRPATTPWSKGLVYFDTTLGKPIWWDGSHWVDSTGTQV